MHLVLVLGIYGSIACFISMVVEMASGDCNSPFCFNRWIAALCILPSSAYFIQTIGAYNQQLKEKKRLQEQKKEELIENINSQVAEVQGYLEKVTATANDFANSSFSQVVYQFIRFLKGVKMHYSANYTEEDQTLEELREFILLWFANFSGSLLAPERSPLMQGLEAEVKNSRTVEELCDKILKRLENNQAQLMADWNYQDAGPMIPQAGTGSAIGSDIESGDIAEPKCGITWFGVGCGYGCGCKRSSRDESRLPITLNCCCLMLKLLSQTHINLILAFFVNIGLIGFEVYFERWFSTALVASNEICVMVVLGRFEQIDEIAQLERDIHKYEERNEAVKRRKTETRERCEKVEQLHDLWKYRTLPCLSIMGKVHDRVADNDQEKKSLEDRLGFLQLANQSFKCLEQKIGTMESWRQNTKPIEDGWKNTRGKQLQSLQTTQDVDMILKRMTVADRDWRELEDALPHSGRSSPSGSFCEDEGSSTSLRGDTTSGERKERRSSFFGSKKGSSRA
jgi:hypothetical protein